MDTVVLTTGYAKPLQGFKSFVVVKMGLHIGPKTFQRVSCRQNCLADLLQAFNSIVGSEIMHDNLPQTFNSLRCRHDIPLQALNYFAGRQNVPVEHLEG